MNKLIKKLKILPDTAGNENKEKLIIESIQQTERIFRVVWNKRTFHTLEEAKIMLLNNANHVIGIATVAQGADNVKPDIKTILATALRYNAKGICLAHNHTSGDASISNDDFLFTIKLQEACNTLDLPLLDHIVLGNEEFFSFKANGLI